MANVKNLKPCEYKLSQEEAKKGGRNSVKARREKKMLRECLEELMSAEVGVDKDGKKIDGATAISTRLFRKALDGDVRAFEVLRDTLGQKPVERVMVSDVDPDVVNEVENIVAQKARELNDKG